MFRGHRGKERDTSPWKHKNDRYEQREGNRTQRDTSSPGLSPSQESLGSITCPIILRLSAWTIAPPLIHGNAFAREERPGPSKRATARSPPALPAHLRGPREPLGCQSRRTQLCTELLLHSPLTLTAGGNGHFSQPRSRGGANQKSAARQEHKRWLSRQHITLRANRVARADEIWHSTCRPPPKDTCDRSCTTCGRARHFPPSCSSSRSLGHPAGEKNVKEWQGNMP